MQDVQLHGRRAVLCRSGQYTPDCFHSNRLLDAVPSFKQLHAPGAVEILHARKMLHTHWQHWWDLRSNRAERILIAYFILLMEMNINIYWLHQKCIWFCVLKLLWFPRSLYFILVLAVMTFDLLMCVHVYAYSILGCHASIHDPVFVGLLHWHHHRCYGLHPLLILREVW